MASRDARSRLHIASTLEQLSPTSSDVYGEIVESWEAHVDEALLAAAVLAGPDAVIAADRGGTITFWNSGSERIFGFAADEALGRSLDLIIPERLRSAHWEGWDRVIATGQSRYGDGDLLAVPAQRKDGTTISVEFTIHPLRGDDGMTGFGATLRDVTTSFQERRELRREVRELRRLAADA